ncbi:hypothetical protein QBC35DRAFT_148388 [Podospora australis]|uniref:Uncharacterized protein n=1 Tax=Podospora australis TaxID=1536484 RepID=A0AAN7ACZ8_9PEZI|nr:hypothetical protein QBC35DRAFT_148388 [Podospora australis]
MAKVFLSSQNTNHGPLRRGILNTYHNHPPQFTKTDQEPLFVGSSNGLILTSSPTSVRQSSASSGQLLSNDLYYSPRPQVFRLFETPFAKTSLPCHRVWPATMRSGLGNSRGIPVTTSQFKVQTCFRPFRAVIVRLRLLLYCVELPPFATVFCWVALGWDSELGYRHRRSATFDDPPMPLVPTGDSHRAEIRPIIETAQNRCK